VIKFFGDVAAALRTLAAERDQLRRALSDAHRAQGEAEGKLAASEMAGVVERWKERAERAEAEAGRLREALRAVVENASRGDATSCTLLAGVKIVARAALEGGNHANQQTG